MSEPENKIVESMMLKIGEVVLEQEDENEDLIPKYDPVVPIAPILCAHLKFFMSIIIKRMAMQKKKYLLSSALLKREKDPKNACSGIASKVVYENTLFTAEDFYKLLKDNRQLIPPQRVYNLFVGRLLNHMSLKRSLQMKRSLKKKEEDDEEETS